METIRFSNRAKTVTVWLLVVLALVLLYNVRAIVVPFFWAGVAAYLLHPLVTLLHRKTRVPRALWIVVIYLVGFALVGWAIAVLVPVLEKQYADLIRDLPTVTAQIEEFIRDNSRLEFYGFSMDLRTLTDEIGSALTELARSLPRQALLGVTAVLETVIKIIIFLVATVHLLLFGERWVHFALSLLPPALQSELTPLLARIHQTLSAYLRTQLIRILMVSSVVYVALTIMQVRFALILALMAGILDIVPIIGPIVSSSVTALVALFQPTAPFGWSNLTLAIATVILYIALNQLQENVILPPLIGYMVDLPPLVVLFAVLAGQQLGGILGLLLAVPIAASIKIILRYLYAKLMDKPVVLEERRPRRRRRLFKRKEAAR